MKRRFFSFLAAILIFSGVNQILAQEDSRATLELRIYTYDQAGQEKLLDGYMKDSFIPALHARGIESVGVFKPREGEQGADSTLYVLIPHPDMQSVEDLRISLEEDQEFRSGGAPVLDASYQDPAYGRMQIMLMQAFDSYPRLEVPDLQTERSGRVYELRSYESATENLHLLKVAMFNEGEKDIFVRLGFQPVFFGQVISGDQMPRLIYLTTHGSQEIQKQHWDAFVKDPKWEEMKNMDRYANTVSHIDRYLLYPTAYSDY